MKGALENVEVLHFFFISVLWGDLVLFPPSPSPHLPLACGHSSGISDKEEWIQKAEGVDGKRTTPIKHIRLISGCGMAMYRCEQVCCRPTRFAYHPPKPSSPCTSPTGGGRGSISCWSDKTVVRALEAAGLLSK